MYLEKRWDRHQILSHLHLPPSHTLTGWRLLISHLQSSFTWNPFPFFPHLSVCPFFAMQACSLSIPAMFESIHLYFSHPRNTTIGPQFSSHRVSTPHTVSYTLSGLAGEKTQAAGGGLGLPESPATLLSHWHWGSAVECLYTLQGGHWGGAGANHRVNMALAIWTAWKRFHSPLRGKQTPQVLVLHLWPASKHTTSVCVCVCVSMCAGRCVRVCV